MSPLQVKKCEKTPKAKKSGKIIEKKLNSDLFESVNQVISVEELQT